MTSQARMPSTVRILPDGTTKVVRATFIPAAIETARIDDVVDATKLTEHLNRIYRALAEVTFSARTNPRTAAITFENVTCNSTGATSPVRLSHNLGRYAKWCVVGWRGASTTAGPSLVEDTLDTSPLTSTAVLVLRSYTAGTADIEVW